MERKGLRHSDSGWLSHSGKMMQTGGMDLSVEISFCPVGVEVEPRPRLNAVTVFLSSGHISHPVAELSENKFTILFNALPFSGLDYLFPKTELR